MKNLKEMLPDKHTVLTAIKNTFFLSLPFILMDAFIRVLASDINYFRPEMVIPNILFTIIWILLFAGISLMLKRTAGRIFYAVCFGVFFFLFFTNSVYYSYTGFFFSFNLVLLASEGSSYILDTILNASPVIFIASIIILLLAIVLMVKFPKKEKNNFKGIGITLLIFVILHLVTPLFMGKANDSLKWDNWRNPRNVYENFNDSNKNMKICGIYEYSVRDFYVTFLKPKEKEDADEIAFLEETYADTTTHETNEYTGIFEGKNVIFLQLEGIDSWLLNSDDMPNLYSMLDHSIVFEEHYSYYNGGGSTFNSELAVNTGLITPISYTQNAYTFNTNYYEESLPKLFKNLGYSVNAFHMNTGEYYSRQINYKNWGYDNYYGLIDESDYDDISYELDRELILNESFYEKMFQQDTPFMNYIISYTPHTPFSTTSEMGQLLAEKIYGEDVPELSEEECARLFASETDYMIGLLLEALEDNDLLDNTVIVAYADHYLYTLNDKTILDKYKETDNNLINHTPFFIWSNDMDSVTIDKVNSQIDILPTVLNLFGIEYTEEYYIGNDIMDEDYQGYVFFSDYSWYDGNVYVENGVAVSGDNIDTDYVNEMNSLINRLVQQNDLTLKYDYFRRMK